MKNPFFSILIAQYNNGKFFEDCYKSIIAQTYQNWEVIIVDDGSTDDSVEQMKEIIGNDSRFKIEILPENRGCGFTKRKCVELATGKICGFLDPDDMLTVDALDEMVRTHHENKDVVLVYSNLIFFDEFMNKGNIYKRIQVENGRADFFNLKGEISAFASFKISYYNKTVGIDNYLQRAVDQDLYFILYEVGKVLYINKELYHYRIHSGGISTNLNIEKAFYWKWITILAAAKRRNFDIEKLFSEIIPKSYKEIMFEAEIAQYNKSIIFKILRKIGLFRLF